MRKTYLRLSFFVVAVCFFVGSLLDVAAPYLLPSPRISIVNNVYDFGTVRKGTDCAHGFEVRNSGSRPLRVSAIRVDCGGCVDVVTYPRDGILPGRRDTIQTVLKTGRLDGKVRKQLLVELNDPINSMVILELTAIVVNSQEMPQ